MSEPCFHWSQINFILKEVQDAYLRGPKQTPVSWRRVVELISNRRAQLNRVMDDFSLTDGERKEVLDFFHAIFTSQPR